MPGPEMGGIASDLAAAYLIRGDWRKILDICTEIIPLFEKTNRQSDYCGRFYPIYPVICADGGFAQAMIGDIEKSDSLHKKAVEHATKEGNLFVLAMVELSYGLCYIIKGDGKHAGEQYERCIEHAEQVGLEVFLAPAWSLLGFAHYLLGELEKALENLRIAEANFREMGMDWWLATVYAAYAELWKRESDAVKAGENLRTAIDIFRECGADGGVKKYEEELARL